MTGESILGGRLTGYLAFAALATAIAFGVGLIGQLAAVERWGEDAVRAWRLGCGVCLLAWLAAGPKVGAAAG